MKKLTLAAIPLAVAGLAFSQASIAEGWQYEITPYLFAAGMKGNVGVGGLPPISIDATFSDITDNLEIGFMGMFTAQKGPWILGFDGSYMKLEAVGPGGKNTITNKLTIMQGSVGYQVMNDHGTKVNLLAGLRYTKLELGLTGVINGSGSESWTDAVVGVHSVIPMTDNVDMVAYADVGGGGSDLTYQFMLGANWEYSDGYTAKLGYRYLDMDYEDNGVIFDVGFSGPYLGLGIAF